MIDLHTVATANGYKASVMLEELGLPYRVTAYDLLKGENFKPELLAINRVARLPVIVDHEVEGGSISIYGSAAILQYLAEKTGRLMPPAGRARAKVIEWLGIISSDIAPAFSGQFVFNVVAQEKQPWAIAFYEKLCLRMAQTLEDQLSTSEYLAGDDYTIADVLAYPVATVSMKRYPGSLADHPHLSRWAATLSARPAVQRGMRVPH